MDDVFEVSHAARQENEVVLLYDFCTRHQADVMLRFSEFAILFGSIPLAKLRDDFFMV